MAATDGEAFRGKVTGWQDLPLEIRVCCNVFKSFADDPGIFYWWYLLTPTYRGQTQSPHCLVHKGTQRHPKTSHDSLAWP